MIQRRFKTTASVAISKNKPRQARLIYGFDGKTSRDYQLDVSKTTKRGLEVRSFVVPNIVFQILPFVGPS